MIRSLPSFCVVASLALAATPAAAGPGGAGHDHQMSGFSAGEPGNPNKPARVVEITMRETDGKMVFVPDKLEMRKDEQVRFVLKNAGALDHEFVLATVKENDSHGKAMMKSPEMEHDDPNAMRVAPNKSSEFVWRFTKRGEFEFACLIPGHREAGMTGTVRVK